jgi:hypothetical protein
MVLWEIKSQMSLNEFVFKYKKAIVIAGANILGLVLILLVVSLIRGMAAGSIPSVNAPASETVAFLANPALKLQPKEQRLEYITGVIQSYAMSPQKQEQFAQAINNLSDGEIEQLQENGCEMLKDQLVEDANAFARLKTPEQRQAFVSERFGQMSSLKSLFAGKGGTVSSGTITKGGSGQNGPDLRASKLNRNVPSDPAAVYSKVVDATNPSERSKVDSYVTALQQEANRAKSKVK